jgi:signal transduction histidine kinase
VSSLRRLGPDTIFGRTVLLLFGVILLLTAINVGIILLRPPPRDVPLDSQEVARLLQGREIAKAPGDLVSSRSATPPDIVEARRSDALVAGALARYLRVRRDDVRFRRTGDLPEQLAHLDGQIEREAQLYSGLEFDPLVVGPFEAALRLPSGEWRALSRLERDPWLSWRASTVLRVLLSMLVVLPVGWWFARKLARPIHAFAAAAEKVGQGREVEPVAVEGPAEVRLAAHAVNDMQTRLDRYLVERTSVVGAVAHDLRTPLARLNFHLADAPEAMRTKAEGEIAEMEQMIAATMDFVQNETRTRVRERLDLALLVEGVVDDFADLGRPVVLAKSEPAIVRGDPLLLKRMFANLVNNALAYGQRASIELVTTDGQAVVDVLDEGPGLSQDELARAFEPFYRAERSRNRATGGIGLGLAIVKAAATAHGGDVELANRSKAGLRARVLLPLDS